MGLRLAVLQLVIVEQRRYKLQEMLCRVFYVVQIINGFWAVYIIAQQPYEAGYRRCRSLYVVRNGKQQALALLHNALGFGFGSNYAVAVAALAAYVAKDVGNEYGSQDDGKQAKGKYLNDDRVVRAYSLVHRLAHSVVLVVLYVFKQFACASGQQYAYTL